MASWADNIYKGASERINTTALGQGAITTIYILLFVAIVLTVVILVDNYYPFLPVNPLGGPSAQARDVRRFWTTATPSSENLIVPASDSPTVRADIYTVSVQLVIGDSRTPSLGQFRHILHRGANPCALTGTGPAGIKVADLPPNVEPVYKNTGLPSTMNPGLFLDKYKNDLHVFVHTRGKENSKEVLWLESLTVEDLPLNTPISIGVVGNGKNIEVYINCQLYSTLLLKGTPYLPKSDNQWFGRYCAFPVYGLVKNLQLWDTALNSDDYMKMCRSLNIGSIDIPKACATA
jgi:hypothetical protein